MGKLNSSRGGDTRHIDRPTILHATKPLILVNTASFSSSASGSDCAFQEGLRPLSKFLRKQSDRVVFEVVSLHLAAMIALSFLENSVFFFTYIDDLSSFRSNASLQETIGLEETKKLWLSMDERLANKPNFDRIVDGRGLKFLNVIAIGISK